MAERDSTGAAKRRRERRLTFVNVVFKTTTITTTIRSHFGSRLVHKRRSGAFLSGLGRCPVSLFGQAPCFSAKVLALVSKEQ